MIRQSLWALMSHWRRNPWQLATLLAGIALSTALWSGVQAINSEARASYAQAADVLGGADVARVLRRDGREISVGDYVALRRLGWQVSPVFEGRIEVDGKSFRVVGLEPLTFPGEIQALFAGADVTDTGVRTTEPVVLVHPDNYGELSGLEVDLQPDRTRPRGTLLADIAVAQEVLQGEGGIRRLLLSPAQPIGLPPLPEQYRVSEVALQADVGRLTRSFHLNLTAFGLLSFAVGIFIVYGAVGLAFEQRRSVFRTLRALGVPLKTLMGLLVIELGIFALISGTIGVTLGYVIAAALLPDVAATLRGLYGADVAGQLQLRASWWASGLGMALGGTAVAAAAALYKLRTMPLLSIAHARAMSVGAANAAQRLAASAVTVFVLGSCFALFGNGLFAGFGMLACLLIGAAFCLPWCLERFLHMAQRRAMRPTAQWFWADSRQQLPGLSMALMALLLAMAANIGVSTMVASFRLTFTDYLDQRLASELYLSARDEAQANEIVAFLEKNAEAVLPIQSVDLRVGQMPVELYGIRDHATYRSNWPILAAEENVWDKLASGQGALISEQLSRRENLMLGGTLPWGDRIVGIYSDYGNSAGQIIISDVLFRDRYPEVVQLRFGIRTNAPEALSTAMRNRFDLDQESLINQESLKRFSLDVFERTFSVTAALNILTLSVAGLAMLISLLTLATMRLPQLAPVWALGLTRVRLAQMEVLRAVCLAALTGILAVPLGLMLSWVLLAVVNVEAFGWRLPMFLFPLEYLHLGLLALAAALVAATWPAIRLARTDPQALLRVFSNDR